MDAHRSTYTESALRRNGRHGTGKARCYAPNASASRHFDSQNGATAMESD